jgi:Fe-Mn family superoxide dismutase
LKILTLNILFYLGMNKIYLPLLYLKKIKMERRKFIKSVGAGAAAMYVVPNIAGGAVSSRASIEGEQGLVFPPLPYAYDALEPYIDARTMEIHYERHHRGYYNNLVNAIKGTSLENTGILDILKGVSSHGDAVRNNAGGYYNHILFWNNLAKGMASPSASMVKALESAFGSFDKFKESLSTAAKTRFGSGWGWLYLTSDKKLAAGSSPNQDNMLMDLSPVKGTPLLGFDVWEHAYYLKYQNKRADYVDALWNIVNWQEVENRYTKALNG